MDAEEARELVCDFAQPALEPRTLRAIEEYMVVLPVGNGSAGLYKVFSESGSEYLVNLPEDRCECLDYRKRDIVCKHQRRARLKHDEQWRGETAASAAETVAMIDERVGELEALLEDLWAAKREYQSLLSRVESIGPATVTTDAASPTPTTPLSSDD